MAVPFRVRHAEWVAGAFLVLVVVVVVGGLLLAMRPGSLLQGRTLYRVVMAEGHGVAQGSRVDMLGIEIGRVDTITITEDSRVAVTLDIDNAYADRIRTDSQASLEASFGLQGVLGGIGFRISPGDPGAELLPPGGELAVVEPKHIADLLPGADDDPLLGDLEVIVHNLRKITDEAVEPSSMARTLLTDVSVIIARLKLGEGTAGKILADEELYDRTMAALEDTHATLKKLDKVAQQGTSVLGRADAMVREAETVMDSAQGAIASTDKAMKSAQTAMEKTEDVVGQTDETMKDLQTTVNNYTEVSKDMRELTANLEVLVKELRVVTEATTRVYPIRRHIKKAQRKIERER